MPGVVKLQSSVTLLPAGALQANWRQDLRLALVEAVKL